MAGPAGNGVHRVRGCHHSQICGKGHRPGCRDHPDQVQIYGDRN